MRTRIAALVVFSLTVVLAAPAFAQYGFRPAANRATGENYHVELGGYFWNPNPDILITSEGIGILGSQIDFIQDLGIERKRLRQVKAVVRPGAKHKFRFEYTPLQYSAESILQTDVVFNGIRFPLELPVATVLSWKAYRFGYEYDFLYRDRGFLGLLLEAKYTDVEASLTNVAGTEFVRARAPIPALGVIGRGYLASNISITGEFSAFKLPESIDENYRGRYFDFDIYGTVNFTDNFGVQGGYRSFDLFYKIDDDEGDFNVRGIYFGGVIRF